MLKGGWHAVGSLVVNVRASPVAVWRVLGERWGDVHRILPSLSASELVGGGPPGLDARRSCTLARAYLGMRQVEERVLAWEEGRSFTYVFEQPPWPVHSIANTWLVEADDTGGTRLTLTPALRMRGGRATQWIAPALLRIMVRSFRDDMPATVEAIERECRAEDLSRAQGTA